MNDASPIDPLLTELIALSSELQAFEQVLQSGLGFGEAAIELFQVEYDVAPAAGRALTVSLRLAPQLSDRGLELVAAVRARRLDLSTLSVELGQYFSPSSGASTPPEEPESPRATTAPGGSGASTMGGI